MLTDDEIFAQERNLEKLNRARDLLEVDRAGGLRELETFASEGSVVAMFYLAEAYVRPPHRDEAKLEKWFRAASDRKSITGFRNLVNILLQTDRSAEAQAMLEEKAVEGDMNAMFLLTRMYTFQSPTPEKSAKIRDLLRRSAELGHIRAKADLGQHMIRGTHGKRNVLKGAWLVLSAAIAGAKEAWSNPDSHRLE